MLGIWKITVEHGNLPQGTKKIRKLVIHGTTGREYRGWRSGDCMCSRINITSSKQRALGATPHWQIIPTVFILKTVQLATSFPVLSWTQTQRKCWLQHFKVQIYSGRSRNIPNCKRRHFHDFTKSSLLRPEKKYVCSSLLDGFTDSWKPVTWTFRT